MPHENHGGLDMPARHKYQQKMLVVSSIDELLLGQSFVQKMA